ncbi:MTOR-associated protein MEAK7-like [Lineus longissimus]|uniref:MTOR-associated protein MEAK7-like n=1 Tax=Lineus longissimus TaxID=88925 RepID=UPI002B4D2DD1
MGHGMSQQPEYESALAVFTAVEQQNISELFQNIAGVNPISFNADQLQAHLKDRLPPALIVRLHNQLSNVLHKDEGEKRGRNTHVWKEAFVVGLSHCLKGTLTQRAQVFLRLATDKEYATTAELVHLMVHLLNAYMNLMTFTPQFKSWNLKHDDESNKELATFLMEELINDNMDQYFEHDLERWLLRSAFVAHVVDYVFNKCFPISHIEDVHVHTMLQQPKIPYCRGVNWDETSSVLSLTSLILLNHSIPQQVSNQWKLLFNSNLHGASFATMLKLIMNKGPSLLIIKDKNGAIFGGFAPESWAVNPQYYGSTSCFLFTIHPKVGRYFPTGYNENYMYLNQMQQTLPNGLGFGGQLWYFGLWLDSEFGKGQSRAEPKCTTFGSPQLSAEPDFEVDTIEVWGVGAATLEGEDQVKTSILDKDPAAKALLSLAGREMVSEGLRETDATAHTPSEHNLHHE